MFSRLFGRSPKSRRPPARPIQSPLESYHETDVLRDIALREALAMGHAPSLIHVLGAALYRLRDADPALAAALCLNVALVRQWAFLNLPPRSMSHKRPGPVDTEYTFNISENEYGYNLQVQPVRRHVRQMPAREAPEEETAPPRQGVVVFQPAPDDQSFGAGFKNMSRLLGQVRVSGEPREPTLVALRRTIAALLSDPLVLKCLADHGVTPETLLAELSQPSG